MPKRPKRESYTSDDDSSDVVGFVKHKYYGKYTDWEPFTVELKTALRANKNVGPPGVMMLFPKDDWTKDNYTGEWNLPDDMKLKDAPEEPTFDENDEDSVAEYKIYKRIKKEIKEHNKEVQVLLSGVVKEISKRLSPEHNQEFVRSDSHPVEFMQ